MPSAGAAYDHGRHPEKGAIIASGLTVKSGPLAGQRVDVTGPMVIGRENADITIHDGEISRRHAEVRLSGAGLEIEDLGSTNGTFVNGERIEGERELAPGDVIKVGNTELALDGPPAQAAASAGAGTTAVSQTPDLSSAGPGDTAQRPAAASSGPSGPIEARSPSPTGIEPGTHSVTPPHGGANMPPQTQPYMPAQTGAYTPPQAQGGFPPAGGAQGPPAGGQMPPPGTGQSPPSVGPPSQGSPGWGSGGYDAGGPGSGGYGGGPGGPSSGKSKAPLIIGIIAGLLVVAAVLVFFVWKPFAESDEDQIREVVTEFGEQLNDPAVCKLVTQQYLEELSGETGEAAVEACESDVAEEAIDIEIKSIDINGDEATVEAEADGEPGTLELEKQDDGEWLISGGS